MRRVEEVRKDEIEKLFGKGIKQESDGKVTE